MFQYKYLIISTIILSIIVGCSDKSGSKMSTIDLESSQSLDSTVLQECKVPPSCYWQAEFFTDSIMVLNDQCNVNERFFRFYNYVTDKSLYVTGNIGNGPNEFVSMPFLVKSTPDKPMVSDPNGFLREISVENEQIVIKNEYVLLAGGGTRDVQVVDDTLYAKNTNFGKGVFCIQRNFRNGNSSTLEWVGMPKTLKLSENESKYISRISENSFAVNKKKNRIMSGMRYYNSIFIYDLQGNVRDEIKIGADSENRSIIDEGSGYIADDALIYANHIAFTDEYVYLVVYAKTFNVMDTAPNLASSYIIKLDWDGKHEKTYNVRGRIGALAVTKDDGELFLAIIEPKDGLSKLCKYQLKQ